MSFAHSYSLRARSSPSFEEVSRAFARMSCHRHFGGSPLPSVLGSTAGCSGVAVADAGVLSGAVSGVAADVASAKANAALALPTVVAVELSLAAVGVVCSIVVCTSLARCQRKTRAKRKERPSTPESSETNRPPSCLIALVARAPTGQVGFGCPLARTSVLLRQHFFLPPLFL